MHCLCFSIAFHQKYIHLQILKKTLELHIIKMKVIVDNKIPYIREAIEQLADEVVYLPGKAFTPEVVKDADALIIRTRTICNRELLEGSNVRFIGTATIGFDHIDTVYCQQAGITWSNCPGCNAGAVLPQLIGGFLKEAELCGFVLMIHFGVLLVSKKISRSILKCSGRLMN